VIGGHQVRIVGNLLEWLPHGNLLPRAVLVARHRRIVALLWAHVPALTIFAVTFGDANFHDLGHVVPVAVLAALASRQPFERASRRFFSTLGLLMSSAALIHISGGYIEAHFHVFVMVAVVALYQQWMPFLVAIAYVAVHHTMFSILLPTAVFNHAAGQQNPVLWALLHAGFVLAAAVVHVVAWRDSEDGARDTLTGLPNASLTVRRLEQALERGPAAVVYLDIDGFKQVNDRLGHLAGDRLLEAVARRMELAVRAGDRLGRMGGDEFALVMPRSDWDDAAVVATRFLTEMSEPFGFDGLSYIVGISAGAAAGPQGSDAEQLIGAADAAMYEAKKAGKGRVVLARPIVTRSVEPLAGGTRSYGRHSTVSGDHG